MTNYEKIISMSIEELEVFLEDIENTSLLPWHFYYHDNCCKKCSYLNDSMCDEIVYDSHRGCVGTNQEVDSVVGEWLKAEVE